MAIMNEAAIKIHVQIFFVCVDLSFQFMLVDIKRTVAGVSYGKSMFSFVRNCQTAFQSGCTLLRPRQWGVRVPAAPHSHQRLAVPVF